MLIKRIRCIERYIPKKKDIEAAAAALKLNVGHYFFFSASRTHARDLVIDTIFQGDRLWYYGTMLRLNQIYKDFRLRELSCTDL
ncbi:hypothetical protein TSAR_002269 [Trichomalopsis sarcophagae]|uniref:Uncharacterized protein n=1 Tax=Trichomalopsis sarcophagae TaxID=543379 RepID=A0A232F8T0_9HYME|nr:hypothetical protein TSAR_002269 [Trichomalopsis sarcophagae]